MVYTVQIIPVENRDTHMLSPAAEIKKRVNIEYLFDSLFLNYRKCN